MDNTENVVRRESRLAVFEHVVEKRTNSKRKKFKTYRLDSDDSSLSESELIVDEDLGRRPTKKLKCPSVRFSEEPLNLQCEWNDCNLRFDSWKKLNEHVINHTESSSDALCKWSKCNLEITTPCIFHQHVSYHGYLTKLKNIGNNVLFRNKLPECKQTDSCVIRTSLEGYICEWEYCSSQFWTIFDFLSHVAQHINGFTRVSTEKDPIICGWKGCKTKFATKSRLIEHLRTHTKEKVIACPTCFLLFSNKTKFCDHRRRQTLTDLESFQCSQCLKLFPSERLLREHIRSHINHYKCTMCDMTCASSSVLAKHIRFKHIKDKSYECNECGKRFVEKYNLSTHLKTHEDDSLKCDRCDFKCRSKVGLRTHFRKKHDQEVLTYECHCCKKKFLRGGYLTSHLMKVHKYHWPSGHSRFKYRKDQDGIYRLQTVRYESLEVTEEMIKSESRQSNGSKQNVSYSLRYDTKEQSGEIFVEKTSPVVPTNKDVIITINDVDEHGNILNTEVVVNSSETIRNEKDKIVILNNSLPNLDEDTVNSVDISFSTSEEQNEGVDAPDDDGELETKIEIEEHEVKEEPVIHLKQRKKNSRRKKL